MKKKIIYNLQGLLELWDSIVYYSWQDGKRIWLAISLLEIKFGESMTSRKKYKFKELERERHTILGRKVFWTVLRGLHSVQSSRSVVSNSVRPHKSQQHQASLSITNCQTLPKSMSIKSVMPSNHLILCNPLLLPPSIFPNIRVFSYESPLCIRWPKYWSFGFNISPCNEHPGLISFRMDWLDLLAVQGTLKSLLQHHSSKASTLWHSIMEPNLR